MTILKRIVENLISAIAWICGFSAFLLVGILLLFMGIFINPRHFDGLIKAGCRFIMRMLFIRIRVEGRENVDPRRTYIFMCNHVNQFDGIVLYGYIANFARGVELDTHFKWFFWGWVLRRMEMIPISRTNARSAMNSLMQAKKALAGGASIMIMPEGTRTLTGKFGPFKKGPFLLAKEAGADIVPMVMIGAFEIKHKGSPLIRPGQMILRFGKPILYADTCELEANELKTLVHNKMLQLFEQ